MVRQVAAVHDATPAQVALAWVLAQGESVLPIPGTKRVRYLEQNAAAGDLELTAVELAELDQLGDATGLRYPEASMGFVAK